MQQSASNKGEGEVGSNRSSEDAAVGEQQGRGRGVYPPLYPQKRVSKEKGAGTVATGEASDNGYDQRAALKAFDDSMAGVKGLVDIEITRVVGIFIFDKSELEDPARDYSPHKASIDISVPTINMEAINQGKAECDEIVGKIKDACESSRFFQVINHGIPVRVLDEMIDWAHWFHEQDGEVKKWFFSRDMGKRFFYNSNHDMYSSKAASWRDTMYGLYMSER
ncbi:1-aminocyclopropane-1-carboxylate oxidase homolog 6-like [Diospyros lotus]|uniref:1-aminocyclopropane-1-carboxylate oxidase homolog 6-like n=1 Tax=Diospyros lotus TaxID=55363 RepID=UPI002250BA7D|nr:1-aminocyclopropane-1-carboxylate oxidase homolog 6-like [Diospyros lotus]